MKRVSENPVNPTSPEITLPKVPLRIFTFDDVIESDAYVHIFSHLNERDIHSHVSISKLCKETTITFVKEKECFLTEKFVEDLIKKLDCESYQPQVNQLKSIQEDLKKKTILNCINLSAIKQSKRHVEEKILDILITLTDIDLLKLICFNNSLNNIKDEELIPIEKYSGNEFINRQVPIQELLEDGQLEEICDLDNLTTRYMHKGFEYFFDLALSCKKLSLIIKEFDYDEVEEEIDNCCLRLIDDGYQNRCIGPILGADPEDRISICARLAESSPGTATTLVFLVFNDHKDRIKALNEIFKYTSEVDIVLTAIKKAHLENDDHQCDFFVEALKYSNMYKMHAKSLEIVNHLQKHLEKKLMIQTRI